MKDRENLRIDIISSISDSYINEATKERISAGARLKKRKKIYISAASCAAAVLIFVSALLPFLLLPSDEGPIGGTGGGITATQENVPVYTGMTVSNESPFSGDGTELLLLSKDKEKVKEKLKKDLSVNPERSLYYAYPGEDIYITVNFDNPDDLEILSFTLNGNKYSSYMFEPGSDMENIVLKVNVGDISGLISYTIDAIKYVHGEKIKDVKIDGERTVSVGIYDKEQPTAEVGDLNLGADFISFTGKILDPHALIEKVGGHAYVILYDGDTLLEKHELSVGEAKAFNFTGLGFDGEYTLVIAAVFDAYDGAGEDVHVLYSAEFSCDPAIVPIFTKTEADTVHFEIQRKNGFATPIKTELVNLDGTPVKSSAGLVTSFENIPRGKFKIKISYSYTIGGVTKTEERFSEEFFSLAGVQPTLGTVIKDYSEEPVHNATTNSMTLHTGVDIEAPEGSRVYSMSDGVVTNVYCDDHYGFTVEVTDRFGYKYFYQCLDENFPVSQGEFIKTGEVVGFVGASAIMEIFEGYHLHFAIKDPSGNAVKPEFVGLPPEDVLTPDEKIDEAIASSEWLKSGITYVIIPDPRAEQISKEYVTVINGSDVAASFSLESPHASIITSNQSGFLIEYDFSQVTGATDIHVKITLSCEEVTRELDCVISLCYSLPDEEA